jgi:hypothetical protein
MNDLSSLGGFNPFGATILNGTVTLDIELPLPCDTIPASFFLKKLFGFTVARAIGILVMGGTELCQREVDNI